MKYIYDLYIPVKGYNKTATHTRCDTSGSIQSSIDELRKCLTPPGWYIQVYKATSEGGKPWTERYLRTESDLECEIVSRERDIWLDKPKETMNEVRPVDRNVKTAAAIGKPQMSAVPPVGMLALGAAMSDGAHKYGRFNWRTTEVTASVFYDAMLRHLLGWWSGEDHAKDSKVAHLGHLMAGAAIVLDAEMHGVFNDDRDAARTGLPEQGWWLDRKIPDVKEPPAIDAFQEMLSENLKDAQIEALEDQVALLKAKLQFWEDTVIKRVPVNAASN